MTDEPAEIAAETAVPKPEVPVDEPPRITPIASAAIPPEDVERITKDLIGVLKTVYDEIGFYGRKEYVLVLGLLDGIIKTAVLVYFYRFFRDGRPMPGG